MFFWHRHIQDINNKIIDIFPTFSVFPSSPILHCCSGPKKKRIIIIQFGMVHQFALLLLKLASIITILFSHAMQSVQRQLLTCLDMQDEDIDAKINNGLQLANNIDHSFPHIPQTYFQTKRGCPLYTFMLNNVFVINNLFKIPMDFPKTKRYTQSTRKCMDQLTSVEIQNEKSSSFQESDKKSKMWRMEHQKCFIRFWVYRLLKSPLEVLSFHSPLKRSSYFKEMSAFLTELLGVQYYKSPKQCKSRFGAVKRKVLKEQKSGVRRKDFDFLDYIIEEGNRFAEEDDIHPRTALHITMQKLWQLAGKESNFMIHIKKLRKFDIGCEVELKNNQIVKYLKMKNLYLE